MTTMAAAPGRSWTHEYLLTLHEEEFRRLVDSDLRGKGDPELAKLLRTPEVVDRWCAALLAMAKSVEGQLGAKKADAEASALQVDMETAKLKAMIKEQQQRDAKWRAGIIRFKTGLEEVMAEAFHIRDSYRESVFESVIAEERNFAQARVRELELAITAHRTHNCNEDNRCSEDHCASDDDLWRLVS